LGKVAVLVTAVALTLGVASVRLVARRHLFPGREVAFAAPPKDFELWSFPSEDGATVHALASIGPDADRVVLHFHNNRETMVDGVWLARDLGARGLGVVLAEFRGYGLSRTGSPSEGALYADAEATLDHLATRGFGPDRVVLSGASLGTGVAAEMARRGRGRSLVLVAPFTSIPEVIQAVAPLVPARHLLGDHFDTLSKAGGIGVPTLVIHGDDDEIVPYAMGAQLASAIPGAELVSVVGGRHGDLFVRDGARLVKRIAGFAAR